MFQMNKLKRCNIIDLWNEFGTNSLHQYIGRWLLLCNWTICRTSSEFLLLFSRKICRCFDFGVFDICIRRCFWILAQELTNRWAEYRLWFHPERKHWPKLMQLYWIPTGMSSDIQLKRFSEIFGISRIWAWIQISSSVLSF